LALSVHHCLENLGISQLGDWDVLAFVHRHGVSLISLEQIAPLIGHQSNVVGDALNRLERGKFIQCSRSSRGINLYRAMALADPERGRYLEYLFRFSESRSGRLQLARELKSVTADARPK
jgi:hypothetical protein